MTALVVRTGRGRWRPATRDEVQEAMAQYVAGDLIGTDPVTSPNAAREYVRAMLGDRPAESFAVIMLDGRHRVLAARVLFHGTIDGASVHPREVVRQCLEVGAAAVILAHNHPSGVPEPSMADEIITTTLRDGLALVDIRVLDHLIVARGCSKVVSLAERGLV